MEINCVNGIIRIYSVDQLVFAANDGSWGGYVIRKAENLVIYIYVIGPEPFLWVSLSNALVEST